MSIGKGIQMRIPLIDLKTQYYGIKKEIDAGLMQLMEESSFVRGPKVAAFEKAFAEYHQVPYCVSLNSGTDALFLTFKALNVSPGDEIITVPFTFVATAETIRSAGASVKFVDIDSERYTLDPAKLDQAITPKTVGIVPVHLYGTPADMDPILAVAEKHGLWVIEDACQAHGALYKGKKVGTLGKAGAFSFYPSKNLGAFGDGGALITSDPKLAEQVSILRDHGQTTKYKSEMIGYNSRLDTFQAAILLIKLAYLDVWNQKRRTVAQWYREGLTGIKEVQLPAVFADCEEVYHLFVIRAEKRNQLAAYLESKGVSTAVYYVVPLHQQTPFSQNGKLPPLPVSESLSQEVLSLPMYPDLSHEQVAYVVEKIKEFYA